MMTLTKPTPYQIFVLFGLTGMLAIAPNRAAAQIVSEELPVNVQFQAPNDAAPARTTGGAVRTKDRPLEEAAETPLDSIQFQLPQEQLTEGESLIAPTPNNNSSVSSQTQIQFLPPQEPHPDNVFNGIVRGNIRFAPPKSPTPVATTGGGIRGSIAFAPPNNPTPVATTGGGIRGNITFAPPNNPAPVATTGGGIRGNITFASPNNPAPVATTGGGVRGEVESEVIPLLPETKAGYTIAPRPTLYLYIPPTSVRQVFFSLQDENRQTTYQTTLEISGQGGIVSITLPENAPELEVGKYYAWFFAPIEPDGILRPDNYGVTGWIKRVAVPSEVQDVSLSPLERAAVYAESGIWYDTLEILASARQVQAENTSLGTEWTDLLKQVGLEAVADRPLVEEL
ncbi:DUF928 domain-containing protein [Lusitaniella coriacea]|uniref:DUF928 domain-containing protein n=1 Tax=Lusitaniella coriacea TaxID=1983105 RepID=UPI003CF96DCB